MRGEEEWGHPREPKRTHRTSHILMVLSSDPVYIHLPSLEKPREVMLSLWPLNCATWVADSEFRSKRRTKLLPAAARRLRSGVTASTFTCCRQAKEEGGMKERGGASTRGTWTSKKTLPSTGTGGEKERERPIL